MNTFVQANKEARDLITRGNFREAYQRIVNIKVNRPDHLFRKIALMVDAGVALRDVKRLKYCQYLMDFHSQDILSVPSFVPFHWLNLGNLSANILALKEHEDGNRCWYKRESTLPIRNAYVNAFKDNEKASSLNSRILCAHGRFLMGLGRDHEAFGLFHKATQLDPKNSEPELGRIRALMSLAGTAPTLEEALLKEARESLVLLEKRDNGSENHYNMREVKDLIFDRLSTADDEPNQYPRNQIEINDQEYDMTVFFLQHQLYLSPCSACRKCDRSIGDSIDIGVKHAVVGRKVPGRYQRMAILVGRLIERYSALRSALFNHFQGNCIADQVDQRGGSNKAAGWKPIPPDTTALIGMLSGLRSVVEGMAAYAALYLDKETSTLSDFTQIMGTPSAPNPILKEVKNPALHAFWDLWADGIEGVIPGYDLVESFCDTMSTPQVVHPSKSF